LEVLVDPVVWSERTLSQIPVELVQSNSEGLGRELFAGFRKNVSSAEDGAVSWL